MAQTDDTTFPYIALQYIPGIGGRLLARLLPQFNSVQHLISASPAQLRSLRVHADVAPELRDLAINGHASRAGMQALTAAERLDAEGWQAISREDSRYPELLLEAPAPPPLLYVNGDIGLLSSTQIAIVGSRHASHSGLENARRFAAELGRCGVTITSGLALGIDAASHAGALQAGHPTIAVLGTGLDRVYPRRHQKLAAEIAEYGAVVSEFPLGTAPQAKNFPQRNRIISGLSRGVLVVEAALRSGSLITARHALEQNREVFAIPGSIHNPTSKGCNALIQQGAKLVQTTADVLEELPDVAAIQMPAASSGAVATDHFDGQQAAHQILVAVGFEPTHTDKIIERSGLPAADVLAALMLLQLRGLVAESPAGFTRVR